MTNFYIGFLILGCSLFLLFLSPKEKNNIFGYKSLQLNTHKDIWKWTNQCFGLLILFGSVGFLLYLSILKIQGIEASLDVSLDLIKLYLLFSLVITECYAWVKKYKVKVKFRN